MSTESRIAVAAERPYDVVIGEQLSANVPVMLGDTVRRVGLIRTASVAAAAAPVADALRAVGLTVVDLVVPDGESAKDADTLAALWTSLGQAGFTRSDAVVGVGGGAVTDLAGFVAASFLRGLPVVHVPTSLLGMVDAAVGGKTGINTAEGKNLVGAFHEPRGVVCDLASLATLPRAELVNGLAEVIKCGFIADPVILDVVADSLPGLLDPGSSALHELVRRAITVKADVVSGDLRESTSQGTRVGREALNYGHTFGHAVELGSRFRLRHGEAVAVGMVFAAELARASGVVGPDVVDRHRQLLELVGLPTSYADGSWEALLATMRLDKKTRGDLLRFVVLDGDVGSVRMLEGPSDEALAEAYAAVSG